MSSLIPIKLVQLVLRVVEEQGYQLDEILQTCQLNFNPLEQQPNLPTHISSEIYNKLYQQVVWLLQDECFGLNLKEKVPSGTFRMMGLCIIHCKDLESAINRAEEFCNFCRALAGIHTLTHNPLIFCDDDTVINCLPSSHRTPNEHNNITAVVASLHMWKKFCSWLTGFPLVLKEVHFKAQKPANTDMITEVFPCPVLYEQSHNGYRFNQHYLKSPIIHNEDSLNEFLKSAPYHLSATHSEDAPVARKILGLIGNDFSQEFPGIETIASKMNMSVRTLRRRLNAENTSFQQVKDNTRLESAKIYLSRPGLKINAVSALMGFEEPSAFHRAFKKWTGQTPGEYRDSVMSNKS